MNEQEFLSKWESEQSMYKAWGKFVVAQISTTLEMKGFDLRSFLKQPAISRVKDKSSLVDKAFYRDKGYIEPYDEITDKVGCRFVVLLVEHIDDVTRAIRENSEHWEFTECRHFSSERDKEPLLFTYQSVHYVVRAKHEITFNEEKVNTNTPCEIQVRTLLQHAYAELTHDAVYKAKTLVQPSVHRTVAKSMALIETTDDFFSAVNQSLNHGIVERVSFQENLDNLYNELVGLNCIKAQKSSIVILDVFEDLINEQTIGDINVFVKKNPYIVQLILQGRGQYPLYSQSIVIFLFWLIRRHKTLLMSSWPLDFTTIRVLAADIGVSLDNFT